MSTQLERFELHGDRLRRVWSLLDCFACLGRGFVLWPGRDPSPCSRCGGYGKERWRA